MGQETSVKNSDSLTEESSETLSEKGKSSSTSDGRSLENIMEENERKGVEISGLREKVQELLDDKEDRIAELEEKNRLSASEEDELTTLQNQVSALKRDKRAKPWLQVQRDISEDVTKRTVDSLDLAYAEEWVEEIADVEGKNVDEFYKEIKKYMRQVDPEASMKLLPRAKKAYKLMKKTQELDKRERDLVERESKFSDLGGSKTTKVPTKEEALDWKGSSNPDKAFEELLKGIQDVQTEQIDRK